MSGLPAQYTLLESLLLFQSLACYGVEAPVFARISDLLLHNDAVQNAPGFQPDRLSPDALRVLYLRLLKDEVRDELHAPGDQDAPSQNGDSPTSRKRKAPSPSLPSVQEAAQHSHLLPQLITKLYARYRRQAIDEIREHEKRYDRYTKELDEIERGEWDERLEREHHVNGTKETPQASPPPAASPAPSAEVAPQEAQGPVKAAPTATSQTSQPGSKEQSPAASQASQGHRRSSAKIESIINHPSSSPANGSASPHPTSAAHSPVQQQAQAQPPPPHQRTPSHPPQPNQRPSSQQQPPHAQYPSPYGPPQGTASLGPSQSPPSQNASLASRPPGQSAAVILPPPPNMANMPFPPPMQVPSMPESNGPYRPPSGSPHQHQRPYPAGPPPHSPAGYHPAPHMGQPGYYPQYPGQHPPYGPPHPPHMYQPVQQAPMAPKGGGGVILEPFQVMAQDPVQAHKAQERHMRQQQAQQAARPTPRAAPSPRTPAATPARVQTQQMPYHPGPPLHATLPPPNATPHTLLRRPPPLRITTKFNSWKQSVLQPERSILEWNPAPTSPISPIQSPELPASAPPSTSTKSKRPVKSKEMPAPDAETPRPGRSARKSGRKARGASVASSAVTGSVRGRTRSQSVASHVDESATDVKAEPSTPAETMESDAQSTTEATPGSGGRRTRRRAGTLQSVPEQPQGANNKRKRDQRDDSETAEPEVPEVDLNMGTPEPPNFVIASRNFARMSVPVMNDITSHKHASLFSNPVKAKDAEGYYDIIRRPQDLKSIRAAITNGSRAVAAATASNADTPTANSPSQAPSTPTQFPAGSTHVTLPISEDLVPPKGIVNSAQLEKELMRMFANAVMFNSGEDGVVSDAVEMARDVEASVANWRAAERTTVFDTPADDLDRDDGGGKRRKL